MKISELLDINRIDALIEAAPESVEMTVEEVAALAEAARIKARDRRHLQVLGMATGWPAKYLAAVKVAPYGAPWLAALEVVQPAVVAAMRCVVVLGLVRWQRFALAQQGGAALPCGWIWDLCVRSASRVGRCECWLAGQ